ncbi:MAG: M6 family metalloprotease domain-containing protein [Muribaculum sp.]|nr:M6 family metalloprotease domain-containing protein [Muribaculum sp.]
MSHLFKRILFSSASIAILGSVANAVPAKPGLIKMTQADGTEINVQLRGDERHHFYLTEDGYMLLEEQGNFYYANIDTDGFDVNSRIKAAPAAQRDEAARSFLATVDMDRVNAEMSARAERILNNKLTPPVNRAPSYAASQTNPNKGLFPDANFPVHGEQRAVVILVEYTDVKFTLADPKDYFTRMLNEEGFNDYGGTGSAKDFFELNSLGRFKPDFDVLGPVTLPQNQAYYGGNNWSGDDQNPEQMVVHACNILDSEVDFSQYDRDGDGVIDNVFIFYAGRGEASGGGANTVWPHSWNVTAGDYTPHYYDGVLLDRYACSNEWESGRPDGVGTFVHEFSHVMGLPDLYATSYTSSFTPGSWSAMDYGPYNNDGMTPPLYGAFERYALGWMEPREITEALSATLHPIVDNVAGVINTSESNEFFLLENRQQEGWDAYVPGHGMLIWHIHYVPSVWNSNVVNNTPSHQYVDIEEADGTQSEGSRNGDPFPGTKNVTSFTADTRPAMRTWTGVAVDLPITNIAEAEGVISFDVLGGKAGNVSVPEVLPATDVTYCSFTANWTPVADTNYYVYVYDSATDQAVSGYSRRNVGEAGSCEVAGLNPEASYYYTLQAGDGWQFSEQSEKVYVTTLPLPLDMRRVEVLPASDVTENSFTANWSPLPDATSYMISVFTMEMTGTNHDSADFTGNMVPDGWASSSGSFYANGSYSGQAIPALRLGSTGESLTSPVYDGPVSRLSFWHRGSKADSETVIKVAAFAGGQWHTVATIPVTTEKGGKVTEITDLPVGTWSVSITYYRGGVNGALALDDIEIDYGVASEKVGLDEYASKPIGDAVSYSVPNLKSATVYYYTVKATDGTLVSLESEPMDVSTLASTSAIDAVFAGDGAVVSADGLTVNVSGAAPTADVVLLNTAGMVVRTAKADASGFASLVAPDSGVYLVRVDGAAFKLLIK